MKRILRWLALALALATLTSCGLPGALVRSTGRLVDSAGNLVAPQ